MNDTVKEDKSIVDPAYRERMKGASDWVGDLMENAALTRGVGAKDAVEEVTDAEGNVTQKGKPGTKGKDVWDIDSIFLLAEKNGIDTTKYEAAKDHPSGVGRMRMTISNMLRARGRKRHGLYDHEGNWQDAPEDFLQDADGNIPAPTENPDGTKIPKAKPEPTEDEGE